MTSYSSACEGEGPKPPMLVGTGLVGMLAVEINFTVLVALVPFIAQDFASTPAIVAWVITAPMILRAVLQPVTGALSDTVNLRVLWIGACAVATLCWLLSALAVNAEQLIAFRTIGGVAEALIVPITLSVVALGATRSRGQFVGYWTSIMAFAPLMGLIVVAWVLQNGSWRGAFLLQFLAGVLALGLGAVSLKSVVVGSSRKFDALGAVLLCLALTPLVVVITFASELGLLSAVSITALLVSLLAFLGFLYVESRVEEPLMPPSLLRLRPFRSPLIILGVSDAAFMCGFFASAYIVDGLGYNRSIALLALAPRALAFGIASLGADRWVRRFSAPRLCAFGLICLAVSLVILSSITVESGYIRLFIALVLAGIGLGLVMPSTTTATLAAGSVERTGTSSGIATSMIAISGALGIAIAAGYAESSAANGSMVGFDSLQPPLLLSAFACLISLSIVHRLKEE